MFDIKSSLTRHSGIPGALYIYGWGVPRHLKKGILGTGTTPKRGDLGTGTTPEMGVLGTGMSRKRGGGS